jgi:hypothetical protein
VLSGASRRVLEAALSRNHSCSSTACA